MGEQCQCGDKGEKLRRWLVQKQNKKAKKAIGSVQWGMNSLLCKAQNIGVILHLRRQTPNKDDTTCEVVTVWDQDSLVWHKTMLVDYNNPSCVMKNKILTVLLVHTPGMIKE